MHRTIDAGPALLALGGLLLLIGLFLPWFDGRSAWTVFEALDLVLAALALAALAIGAGRLAPEEGRAGLVVALAALAVVAVQLIDPPPVVGTSAARDTGAWLSLVATLLMGVGAVLTVARLSISVDVRERERRRRVAVADRRVGNGGGDGEGLAATEVATDPVLPPEPAPAPRRAARLIAEEDDQRTQAMPALEEDPAARD